MDINKQSGHAAQHGSATALLQAGVLDRTPSGAIEFPYEAVKVEFLLQAA